jgi:hypothetical protein
VLADPIANLFAGSGRKIGESQTAYFLAAIGPGEFAFRFNKSETGFFVEVFHPDHPTVGGNAAAAAGKPKADRGGLLHGIGGSKAKSTLGNVEKHATVVWFEVYVRKAFDGQPCASAPIGGRHWPGLPCQSIE